MRAGRVTCGCVPCVNDCCCSQFAEQAFRVTPQNNGCCDCSKVMTINVSWNFTGVTGPDWDLGGDCPVPDKVPSPGDRWPECVQTRLDAHGGFDSIEVYTPTFSGPPDASSTLPADILQVGACMTGELCNRVSIPKPDCYIGIIVRAVDGEEVVRCAYCFEAADVPLAACGSSSGDSDGTTSDDSSATSDDSTDSSGGSDQGGDDSGSSVGTDSDSGSSGESGSDEGSGGGGGGGDSGSSVGTDSGDDSGSSWADSASAGFDESSGFGPSSGA